MEKVDIFNSAVEDYRKSEEYYESYVKKLGEIGVVPISGGFIESLSGKRWNHIFSGLEELATILGYKIEPIKEYGGMSGMRWEGFIRDDRLFFSCMREEDDTES